MEKYYLFKFHEEFRTLDQVLKIVNLQKKSTEDNQLLRKKNKKVQKIFINCLGILQF